MGLIFSRKEALPKLDVSLELNLLKHSWKVVPTIIYWNSVRMIFYQNFQNFVEESLTLS